MHLTELLPSLLTHLEQQLEAALPPTLDQRLSPSLEAAMRYSVLQGGKRVRPLLVYTVGSVLNAPWAYLDKPAIAIEYIHCYSLIHDDLPAIDNDDLRRGKPTCHKAFSEATAILAGDALQALAFQMLSQCHLDIAPDLQRDMFQALASACNDMVQGQALDLTAEGQQLSIEELSHIHQLKTGRLIQASIKLGALAAGCKDTRTLNALDHYAKHIGLAFQVQDDILNVIGDTALLGKATGTDNDRQKATFPALLGLENAKDYASELYTQAKEALKPISSSTDLLIELTDFFKNRSF